MRSSFCFTVAMSHLKLLDFYKASVKSSAKMLHANKINFFWVLQEVTYGGYSGYNPTADL